MIHKYLVHDIIVNQNLISNEKYSIKSEIWINKYNSYQNLTDLIYCPNKTD